MSAPGIVSGRNLVIASVQASAGYTPLFFVGSEGAPPPHRPNGGDLEIGDIYYDTELEIMYMWTGVHWSPSGGPGLFNDIYDKLEEIEDRLNKIENSFDQGPSS